MGLFSFFASPAEPEDQGGSCDTTSKIHYCNESEEEMKNNSAVHCEHTGNTPDIRGEGDEPRFNTTILEADDRDGHYHPAKHSPGR